MAPAVGNTISNVNKTIAKLKQRQTIPLTLREDLKERLCITFEPFQRLHRSQGTVPRPAKESRIHHIRKRARQVYLEILDEIPQIYLPFILAVPPPICRSFDSSGFKKEYNQKHPQPEDIELGLDAKALFKQISDESNFNQSTNYNRLIQILFPKSRSARFRVRSRANERRTYSKAIQRCRKRSAVYV